MNLTKPILNFASELFKFIPYFPYINLIPSFANSNELFKFNFNSADTVNPFFT